MTKCKCKCKCLIHDTYCMSLKALEQLVMTLWVRLTLHIFYLHNHRFYLLHPCYISTVMDVWPLVFRQQGWKSIFWKTQCSVEMLLALMENIFKSINEAAIFWKYSLRCEFVDPINCDSIFSFYSSFGHTNRGAEHKHEHKNQCISLIINNYTIATTTINNK